jgi:hypothetical protein
MMQWMIAGMVGFNAWTLLTALLRYCFARDLTWEEYDPFDRPGRRALMLSGAAESMR